MKPTTIPGHFIKKYTIIYFFREAAIKRKKTPIDTRNVRKSKKKIFGSL